MNEFTVAPIVPAATAGNLTNLIAERAWFEPERITMSRPLGDGWQSMTAREVEAEVRATAKGLVACGIQIGDRVAIMARTRYEWTILDFAIWFAGACVVPIYETSSAEQVDWILNDSGSVALIVETPILKELVTPILPQHTRTVMTMTERTNPPERRRHPLQNHHRRSHQSPNGHPSPLMIPLSFRRHPCPLPRHLPNRRQNHRRCPSTAPNG